MPKIIEAGELTAIIAFAWACGIAAVVASWYWFLAVAWLLRAVL